jgi:glycosyltransferase involved in cell wall biosynthesis
MRFSLVVPTLGRVQEVRELLKSLQAQQFTDFEVFIVDQNDDDRLGRVIDEFASLLNVTRIRSAVHQLSHARNAGLAHCRGEIIAVPDDDCVYPPDVLAKVDAAFRADPSLALLSGPAITPEGKLSSGRWETASHAITMRTVWTSVIAFNLFISAAAIRRAGQFDELLGVGAKFGSCEETDLVIRILQTGGKAFYDYSLRVIHPDKALTLTSLKRAFAYGTGLGYVLRKHRVSSKIVANFFIRPAGGITVSLLRGNFLAMRYYWLTLKGRVSGYLASTAGEPQQR